jgi:DNA-binding NarL/FixJ family response regulator
MIKILIADDQALFLDMLCTIISSYKENEIVARASNGKEAVELYLRHKPDVCLLDIQMPITDGIEALKQIKQHDSNAKVIMLTTFSDDENILTAYKLFADGYILKDVKPEVLINAINCVCYGLVCMNKRVMAIINNKISELEKPTITENKELNTSFNPKDIEIIRLIGGGLSNRLIAEKLNYSEGTIRNRISAILSETGLTDRTQIALFAIKNRLV